MVDLLHVGLDAVLIVTSLTLAFYCSRLLNKFFDKSIFEASIKALSTAGFLFAGGTAFDMFAKILEFQLFSLHIFHITLDILGVVAVLYAVRRQWLAWTKLGSR